MLAEFLAFNDNTMPPPEKSPTYKWNNKLNKSTNKSIYYSKYSNFNIESLEQSIEEEMTLAEKIMQRQQEEKEKMEEKKRKVLKELHKKKRKINLRKFLIRETGYEQKKNYNLEQKRLKELEIENKNFKDKPLLSIKSLELIKTKKIKPAYLLTSRPTAQIKKKYNENKLNKSMDNLSRHENNEIKKPMTKKKMIEYYKRQYDWKNKLYEIRYKNDIIKNKKEENEYKKYFKPKLSRGTKEIISAMNESKEKENNLYQTIESNDYFDNNTNPNHNNDDVYKRLYENNQKNENKKYEFLNKYLLNFIPITNKTKYKKILPKYKDIDNNISYRNKKKPKKKKRNKSTDIQHKKYIYNKRRKNLNSERNNFKKADSINEPWFNYLVKLRNNKKSLDHSYRLNIRQSSAWNENDINIVPFQGKSKEIVKLFL